MFIERSIYSKLIRHIPKKEISLIIGPRQAGKTTLMLKLQDELNRQGIKTLFLSLDFERDLPSFQSQASLLQRIELELGKGPGVVFIDEIQRKENAGLFLKGLYDMGLGWKLVVSGSGSMELKEKICESLARNILLEYMTFGGYPRVVLEETTEEKIATLDEIFSSRILTPEEMGFLFQNLVLRILDEKYFMGNVEIRYWRTTNKAEVDFVLEVGSEIIPVEVKWTERTPKVTRSLRSFIEKYGPKEAWVVTPFTRGETKAGKTAVRVITLWDLMEME